MLKKLRFVAIGILALGVLPFALAPLFARYDAGRAATRKKPVFSRFEGYDLRGGESYKGLGYAVSTADFEVTEEPPVYDRVVSVNFLLPGLQRFGYSITPPAWPAQLTSALALKLASEAAKAHWVDFDEFVASEAHYDSSQIGNGSWFICWMKQPGKMAADGGNCNAAAIVKDKTQRVSLFPR